MLRLLSSISTFHLGALGDRVLNWGSLGSTLPSIELQVRRSGVCVSGAVRLSASEAGVVTGAQECTARPRRLRSQRAQVDAVPAMSLSERGWSRMRHITVTSHFRCPDTHLKNDFGGKS
jgi:hypothetical protein